MTAAGKKGKKEKGQPDSCWLASHLCKVRDGLQAWQFVWPAIMSWLPGMVLGGEGVAKCLLVMVCCSVNRPVLH